MKNKYEDELLEIARLQHMLLMQRADISERIAIPPPMPKTGFFRKTNPAYLERLSVLQRINELKARVNQGLGTANMNCWWNFSWEELEQALANDLAEIRNDGPWSFEYSSEALSKDDITYLFLHEIGHCNVFDVDSRFNEYDAMDIYDSERKEILRKYDERVRDKETDFLITNYNSLIYSSLTDRTFTASGYLQSLDHDIWKSHYRDQLENSMKDIHSNTTTYAMSRSTHYEAVYLAGCYKVNVMHELEGCYFYPYTLNYVTGDMPPKFLKNREQKNTLAVTAAFMMQDENVEKLKLDFFEGAFSQPSKDFVAAAYNAGIIAFMAEKIE